jgi:Protein of unknown function (DUF2857)
MFQLKDPDIQQALLAHTIHQIERGQVDALVQAGVSPETLDLLREMRASDLRRLADQPLGFFVKFDAVSLTHQVRSLSDQREAQMRLEYFVMHAAPSTLLRELFTITRGEITQMRTQLGVTELKPQVITESLQREVVQVWTTLRKSVDWSQRTRAQHQHLWKCLHEHFAKSGLSMATLYSQVLSFERLGVKPSM